MTNFYKPNSDAPGDQARSLSVDPSALQRTGFQTLLFLDMVGSTKLKEDLGDAAAVTIIHRHHAIVREILSRFAEAQEIGTSGDEFFLCFGKPSDAVQFSLLLQARLRGFQEKGAILRDRIGIHMGEVVIQEGEGSAIEDLYGIHVDTCARVMSLGEGDQILMTRGVFDNARLAMKGREMGLFGELNWLNHGRYGLKGVRDPIEVFEVGEAGMAVLAPPKDSPKAKRLLGADDEPVLGWRPAAGEKVPGTGWVLERKLGEGAVGEVWLGKDRILKSSHVFKFCFRSDRVRSLKREVTLFRVLREKIGNHPHIVSVEATYFDEPPYFIVLRHVEGMDLPAWVESRGGFENVAESERFEIVAQAAEALQAAHDCGVIHFDIKPSNILVGSSPGNPLHAYVSDFGIGRVVSSEALEGMTSMGFTQTLVDADSTNVSGTHLYMAPEIASGKGGSARSDIYSLGVVLYQMVVGDFTRPVTMDWTRHVEDPLVREDLALCFSGNPEERFAGAAQLAANLRNIGRRRDEAEAKRQEQIAAEKAARRNVALRAALAATLILFALAGAALVAWMQSRKAEESRLIAAGEARRSAEMRRAAAAEMTSGAERMIEDKENGRALANLAQALRTDPDNRVAAQRIVSLLLQKNFALPWIHETPASESFTAPPQAELRVSSEGIHVQIPSEGFKSAPLQIDKDIEDGRRRELARNPIVTVSPDRKTAAIKLPYRIVFQDLTNGDPIGKPAKNRAAGFAHLRFAPDGGKLWISSMPRGDVEVLAIGEEKSEEGFVFHNSPVARTAFSSDGLRLASYAREGVAGIWCTRSKTPLIESVPVDAHLAGSGLDSKKLLPDGPLLSSSGAFLFAPPPEAGGKPAFLWDIRSGATRVVSLAIQGERGGVFGFSPDSKFLAFPDEDGSVVVWNLEQDNASDRFQTGAGISTLDFGRDGKWLAAGLMDGLVRIWNPATGASGTSIDMGGRVRKIDFSPTEDKIAAITNAGSGVTSRLRVWNPSSGKESFPKIERSESFYVVKFSPDGRSLFIGGKDMEPFLLNAETGETTAKFPAESVLAADFDPRGKRIVLASGSRNAAVLYSTDRSGADFILPHSAGVVDARFSPDGNLVATASMDGTARVWDANSGKPLSEPVRHVKRLNSVDFDPRGLCLLTTDGDGRTRVWDALSGMPVSGWMEHGSEAAWSNRSRFSPDGRWIATSGPKIPVRVSDWITVEAPAPAWLADLAEAVGGFRINESKTLEPTPDPVGTLKKIATGLDGKPGTLAEWARWILTPRDQRTISPYSQIHIKDSPPPEPVTPLPVKEKAEEEKSSSGTKPPRSAKEQINVAGKVVGFETRGANGMVKILELEPPGGEPLQLVFFEVASPEFTTSAVQSYLGKDISAQGLKRQYRGRDQIQIVALADIRVDGENPPTSTSGAPLETSQVLQSSNPSGTAPDVADSPEKSSKKKTLKEKAGKKATVVGRVEGFYSSPSNKVKLLKVVERSGEKLNLTFFPGKSPEALTDEVLQAFVGQEITVRGKISLHRDEPQIILEGVEQIYVIQPPLNKSPTPGAEVGD